MHSPEVELIEIPLKIFDTKISFNSTAGECIILNLKEKELDQMSIDAIG